MVSAQRKQFAWRTDGIEERIGTPHLLTKGASTTIGESPGSVSGEGNAGR